MKKLILLIALLLPTNCFAASLFYDFNTIGASAEYVDSRTDQLFVESFTVTNFLELEIRTEVGQVFLRGEVADLNFDVLVYNFLDVILENSGRTDSNTFEENLELLSPPYDFAGLELDPTSLVDFERSHDIRETNGSGIIITGPDVDIEKISPTDTGNFSISITGLALEYYFDSSSRQEDFYYFNLSTLTPPVYRAAETPEPATLLLLALGLGVAKLLRVRQAG